MKTPIFRSQNTAAALGLGLFCLANHAQAAANYDSSVGLAYSIAVLDSSNPAAGDSTGLAILGTYQQLADDWSFYGAASGDGQYQSYSPNPATTRVDSPFNGAYSVSGGAEAGSVDTLHTVLFGLAFTNAGPYSYDLAVTLDYSLQAAASGEFAASTILFDYWDEAGSVSGFDYASAAAFAGYLDDLQSVADTATWFFTLAPGAGANLYAQASIESHVEAAGMSPVPLPGAVWLFAGAIGAFGLSGRRRRGIS